MISLITSSTTDPRYVVYTIFSFLCSACVFVQHFQPIGNVCGAVSYTRTDSCTSPFFDRVLALVENLGQTISQEYSTLMTTIFQIYFRLY